LLVDFHSHTLKSDGTSTPAQLHQLMVERGVEIYAVTDHDTLAAYPELPTPAHGPKLIVGIEINTTFQGDDVHILGYGLPASNAPIDAALSRHRKARLDRLEAMVQKLRGVGVMITFDDVREGSADASSLGRPHIAKALVAHKYAENIEDAFDRYLRSGRPGFVETAHVTPFEAIRLIKESGGIPVLAHPGRLKDPRIVDTIAEAGILGIEVFYGTHTLEQTQQFRHAAEHYGLVMSAGADFHDAAWTPWGVGMHVADSDITPFLKLIGAT